MQPAHDQAYSSEQYKATFLVRGIKGGQWGSLLQGLMMAIMINPSVVMWPKYVVPSQHVQDLAGHTTQQCQGTSNINASKTTTGYDS
jgi:hypothetical protein